MRQEMEKMRHRQRVERNWNLKKETFTKIALLLCVCVQIEGNVYECEVAPNFFFRKEQKYYINKSWDKLSNTQYRHTILLFGYLCSRWETANRYEVNKHFVQIGRGKSEIVEVNKYFEVKCNFAKTKKRNELNSVQSQDVTTDDSTEAKSIHWPSKLKHTTSDAILTRIAMVNPKNLDFRQIFGS